MFYTDPNLTATDEQEIAYENVENRIDSLDGKFLYESENFQMDDTDGMFDMLNLPAVFTGPARKPWDELGRAEQILWDNLAAAIKAFAFDRLDPDKVMVAYDTI